MNENTSYNGEHELRGLFIAAFAEMEAQIDDYLSTYFTIDNPNKGLEIIEVLIDRIPFESKRTALKVLLDQKDDRDFKAGKHGNKKKNHKKVLEEIRKLAHIRNYFAHYSDHPFAIEDKVLAFRQYRDKTKLITYSLKEFLELIDDIHNCADDLRKEVKEILSVSAGAM